MYQKMTHTLEDLKKLAAMELRDVNREELVDILSSAAEEPFRLPLKHCRGRFIRLVSNLQLWKMTFAAQIKLPKKLQGISMERPLIRFVRNLLPIARITLKKVH